MGIAFEPAGTLVAVDELLGGVLRVDPVSGDRTIVSGGPIGAGPPVDCASGSARESSGTIVLAACTQGIIRVDPATGDRTVVSDASTGGGPLFEVAADVAVEPSGTLVVADGATVKRVHPVTGDRTVLSNRRRGGFRDAQSVALDGAGRAIVADRGNDFHIECCRFGITVWFYGAVVGIDLATGRGEVVAGGGLLSGRRGEGASFLLLPVVKLALENSGAVALARPFDLQRVDLATGDRTLLAGENRGSGISVSSPEDVAVDSSGGWLFTQWSGRAIVKVDPATGDRTVVSGQGVGSGPLFDTPQSIVVEPEGTFLVTSRHFIISNTLYPYVLVMRIDPATGDRTIVSRY
jgi:hypothetical protein